MISQGVAAPLAEDVQLSTAVGTSPSCSTLLALTFSSSRGPAAHKSVILLAPALLGPLHHLCDHVTPCPPCYEDEPCSDGVVDVFSIPVLPFPSIFAAAPSLSSVKTSFLASARLIPHGFLLHRQEKPPGMAWREMPIFSSSHRDVSRGSFAACPKNPNTPETRGPNKTLWTSNFL